MWEPQLCNPAPVRGSRPALSAGAGLAGTPDADTRVTRRRPSMDDRAKDALTKVPAVTLGFWIIKILCTTLGETGGDTVSMTWLGETTAAAGKSGLNGYLVGTAIFGALLAMLVIAQIRARRFNPWLYWATIVASTTAGTTLAD